MNTNIHLSVLLVEDDQTSRSILEKYILRMPFLWLVETSKSTAEAIDEIYLKKPDIIIVDVNLSMSSGLELVKNLTLHKPQVIVTTSQAEHAIEGFNLDVTDFLLKPFDHQRFTRAIYKVKQKFDDLKQISSSKNEPHKPAKNEDFIWIKVDKKMMHVNTSEIVYVEGLRDYIRIHLNKTSYITNITMTKIEETLGSSKFIRVNRSFIVNVSAIICVNGNTIETPLTKLPIGLHYKDSVKQLYS